MCFDESSCQTLTRFPSPPHVEWPLTLLFGRPRRQDGAPYLVFPSSLPFHSPSFHIPDRILRAMARSTRTPVTHLLRSSFLSYPLSPVRHPHVTAHFAPPTSSSCSSAYLPLWSPLLARLISFDSCIPKLPIEPFYAPQIPHPSYSPSQRLLGTLEIKRLLESSSNRFVYWVFSGRAPQSKLDWFLALPKCSWTIHPYPSVRPARLSRIPSGSSFTVAGHATNGIWIV